MMTGWGDWEVRNGKEKRYGLGTGGEDLKSLKTKGRDYAEMEARM